MKRKYIIILALLIGIMPIVFNEIKNRAKYNLINDGKKLYKDILEYIKDNNVEYEEIIINDKYFLKNKKSAIIGSGHIFIDKEISFMLSRNNMCVMKLEYDENLMFQNEECPTYRMFNGIKERIVTDGDGLYKKGDSYYYQGDNVSNNVLYDDKFWKILSFDSDGMHLVNNDENQIVIDKNVIISKGIGEINNPYIID